ncbi:YigZ family protein [Demequina zhanjiangensis]|uniref:YigZ family protein n=1 Tax=Demequina zhanjiangensis TaxID=3051659 RepID=A0ABT8G1J7_9MICO|nr:YigZ family protein [Demequina sp. SYSU T00b26]MDN4473011.1 YigZ family protein [Demequina sp. SYSU T00b26]
MTSSPLPSTIASPVEHSLEIKKSVFLAHLEPVGSMEEADAVIAAIRKEHWDARHHCTALILGDNADRQRSNDDGEPAGTAGVPMLEVLRHRQVTDLVAVVTRWFGGTLLGAGGLVRAYGSAVSEALDRATVVERVPLTRCVMEVPHADAGRVLSFLHQWAGSHAAVLDEPTYVASAHLTVHASPEDVPVLQADVASLTQGAIAVVPGETSIVDRPVQAG